MSDSINAAVLRTLLVSDMVDSTRLAQKLGDERMAAIWRRHDRIARDLLHESGGREADRTDGFLMLFERPINAVLYAAEFHRAMRELGEEEEVDLGFRVGIHLGEVVLIETPPEDIARGAKPLEVEGLAKPMAARLMSVATAGQTLLSRGAFDVARRAAVGADAPGTLRWLAHGEYKLKGVEEAVEVFEIGLDGEAPLQAPPDTDKVKRLEGSEILGWRPAAGLEVPTRPNWTLERRLGEGGFGEAWLGIHKAGYRRVFKFCFTGEPLEVLRREITLFRLLRDHLGDRPDITRILDWNFDDEPYFLESEYTAGGNLLDWAEAQGGIDQVPLETRFEIIAQTADALAAAHSIGVLHKDVKPANILIDARPDGSPQVRLTDFGIGVATDEDALARSSLTRGAQSQSVPTSSAGSSAEGTLLYMAPEVREGKTPTIQADIYALGTLLYQMAVADFRRSIAPGWERDVDDDILREDINHAVAGTPDRRLTDAAELAKDVRRLEERRRERAEQINAERREARASRTRKIGVVAFFFLACIVVVLWSGERRANREAERANRAAETADREAERANREAETAEQVSTFLVELFEVADPGRLDPDIAPADQITARQLLEAGAGKLSRLDDQPLVQARLQHTIGEIYRTLGLYDPAADLLESAATTRENLLPGVDPDVISVLNDLAVLYWRQGRLEEAENLLTRVLDLREQAQDPSKPSDPQIAQLTHNLAILHWTRGDYDEAEPLFRRGIRMFEEAYGPEHPEVAAGRHNLGLVLRDAGRLDEAEPLLYQAHDLYKSLLGEDHPNYANVLKNLGILHTLQGRYDEAGPLLDQALEAFERILDEEHPKVGETLLAMAELERAMGNESKAAGLFKRAISVLQTALGEEHPNVVKARETAAAAG